MHGAPWSHNCWLFYLVLIFVRFISLELSIILKIIVILSFDNITQKKNNNNTHSTPITTHVTEVRDEKKETLQPQLRINNVRHKTKTNIKNAN